MTVGEQTGPTYEQLVVEPTDFPESVGYVRKSRIVFPGRDLLHHETGYLRVEEALIMLSRGTYVVLAWNEKEQRYEYVTSSAGTRGAIRKITFPTETSMVWDESMEVQQHGEWRVHSSSTEFRLVAKD